MNEDNIRIERLTGSLIKSILKDFPETKINGSIYLISSKNLRKYKSFVKPSVLPLVQNHLKESIDIDTYDDWKIAEKLKQ